MLIVSENELKVIHMASQMTSTFQNYETHRPTDTLIQLSVVKHVPIKYYKLTVF